jgi:hypothetical protein
MSRLAQEHSIDRKTSLLRDRTSSARGQASAGIAPLTSLCCDTILADHAMADERQGAWSTRTAFDLRRTQTRTDLLFTMSDNTRPPHQAERRETLFTSGRASIPFAPHTT